LSRLELSEAEIDAMQGDMSKILDFVAQVEKLDLEGVEPLTQMSKSVNVMRQDEVANMISKEDALKNAPDANSDYFRVSKFGKKV
jgi:aspartyl-tRNA(Asn)/glutamyl-tRNA(Gln) amidotransferase subunit C